MDPDLDDVTRSPACSPIRAAIADRDGDVLALIERGDTEGAVRRLMVRHGTAIYRFCREALHDAALADDVHQQVFIAAFNDLSTFRRCSTVRAWLFGIARHRILDAAKSRGRAHARIEEADPTELPDLCPSPSAVLDDAQLQEALVACMRELDEGLRVLLLLRYQQGLSFEEMAIACGEKAGTLHARVARALPVLRARIERRLAPAVPAAARRMG